MKSRISVYTRPLPEITSYYEMVDFAAEYGLNLETISSRELEVPDTEFAKRLREYADRKCVMITCVSAGINLVGADSAEMIEKTKKYAEVAAILGSPYLHHTIALYRMTDEELKNRELYIEKGLAAVREIYDYADSLGIKAVYEDQGFIFNGIDGFKLIEKAGRDTKVVADFGNIQYADENVEDFIPVFYDKIVHVHVKDYKRYPQGSYTDGDNVSKSMNKAALEPCLLGEGCVNFDAAFKELEKIDYNGYVSLENTYVGENARKMFEKDIEFLKKYVD